MKQIGGPTKKQQTALYHAECPQCGSIYEFEEGDSEIKRYFNDNGDEWDYCIVCHHCAEILSNHRWKTIRKGG